MNQIYKIKMNKILEVRHTLNKKISTRLRKNTHLLPFKRRQLFLKYKNTQWEKSKSHKIQHFSKIILYTFHNIKI